ncbi:MAG: NAD-binding protein, partial [Cyclobacteriaceae bacterium]|nr:NAD-binding protein [Cyclobacteriaceae bacterium]
MKIIIAGAGEVGFHLAKLLTYEKQEIVIIDLDQERLNYVGAHLDVHTVKGSSTSYKFLEAANVSKSDLLISVTSSEETNLAT